jgi:hypothetical protein
MWEHWVNLFPGLTIPSTLLNPVEEDKIVECKSFEDVRLYTSPWVSGYTTRAYHAPVEINVQDYDIERGLFRVKEKIKRIAFDSGANAVVALNTDIYAWESPIKFNVVGTPAKLSRL